jgi:hypothetical protein
MVKRRIADGPEKYRIAFATCGSGLVRKRRACFVGSFASDRVLGCLDIDSGHLSDLGKHANGRSRDLWPNAVAR